MAKKLFTSKEWWKIIEKLGAKLWMKLSILARIALALSLNRNRDKVEKSEDSKWIEFNRYSLMGDEELFYKTLLESIYNKHFLDDEFFWNSSILKYHIDAWLKIIRDLYNDLDKDTSELIIKLLEIDRDINNKRKWGTIGTQNSWKVYPLKLTIGKDLAENNVYLDLNNKVKHWNSHLAIMWKPGTWKTQLLLNILCQIREKSNFETNFIFFDYKWEDAIYKDLFVKYTKPDIFIPPEDKIPINPFILESYDDVSIKLSAREKADSFSSIGRWFWPVQKWNLQDIIIACYNDKSNIEQKYPDFGDIYNKSLEVYKEKKIKNDTLSETLRALSDFWLFSSNKDKDELMITIHNKTFILWLNRISAEGLKELVAYLVIEKLYKEMKQLPESEIKDWYRQIRTILVIDEAHNYLSQKNIFLQKIIREGRSKGIVVFFASQSPKDYEQDSYDFKENLEFSLMFWVNELSNSSIEKLIWCNWWITQEIKNKISNFRPWEVLMKSKNSEWGYLMFNSEPFWKRYTN
jgi:hypothetical protein